jgi:Na+:H+ antiporter, NhaA family
MNFTVPLKRASRACRFAVDHYLALPLGVVAALIWVQQGAESYFRFSHALSFAVNEVGMALFLAVMTKEIVEALSTGGTLHSWRRRSMAIVAGVGGMIGAALTYFAYLETGDELSVLGPGWPIPCAIDLAFCYFVVKGIFGRHSAVSFALLLAIVTDVLEFLIVALRYPVADVRATGVVLMAAAILVAIALRKSRVRRAWPYIAISGGLSWAALFWGGLHPAFALVPVVPFLPHAPHDPGFLAEPSPDAHDPLNEFERTWKYPVHVVVFLFGLVNAGVLLQGFGTGSWAVLMAALAGRPLGILLAVGAGVAAGLHLPIRIGWRELVVVAFAASIGFAFSLLVATQAFGVGPVLIEVKIGALLSLCGAIVALVLAAVLRVGKFAPQIADIHASARLVPRLH